MDDALRALRERKLLFLNWRDRTHPQAGGAEIYCEEMATRFAAAGASITLFTSQHSGAASCEVRSGFRIIRRGGTFGLYARAATHLLVTRGHYDAVVDFQNGIPFFSPLFLGRTTAAICVIHHVHQDQFDLHFPWPMNQLGRVLEGAASRSVYGSRPVVAVSPSTRTAVRRSLEFSGPIFVVPNGTTPPHRSRGQRSAAPTIACVTRLAVHKRMDLLVRAVPVLRRLWPDLRVELAGDGPERSRLEALATQLGVHETIRFHGYVSPERRWELLTSAWLTVTPSLAEGWALSVVDANSAGVPTVAFAVAGLRDSVIPGVTGWLVEEGGDLVTAIDRALSLMADPDQAELWANRCRQWALRFSWDESADRLARVIGSEIDRVRSRVERRQDARDLAVVADFDVENPVLAVHALQCLLRRTDFHFRVGNHFRVLLYGCDESEALRALRRTGVVRECRLRLALPIDLLDMKEVAG